MTMSYDDEFSYDDLPETENIQSQNGSSFKVLHDNTPQPEIKIEWTKHLHNQLRALNSEFASMGFQGFLSEKGLDEGNAGRIHVNLFANACYNLFQRYLTSLSTRESMDDSVCRLTGDLEHSRKLHRRCQEELELARISIASAKERERKLEAEKSVISGQLKTSKEAMRRLQNETQQRTSQFQHEMKKREHESFNLRKRLTALMRAPTVTSNTATVAGKSLADAPRPPSRPGTSSSLSVRRSQSSNRSNLGSNMSLNSYASGDEPIGDLVLRSQLDLAQNQISHLENRENDLFYENRELRDLVSVLATRMFRFARYCRFAHLHQEEEEEEETSLDGSECRFGQLASDPSSDEDDENSTNLNMAHNSSRRQSANVHTLLLQMPFEMVRGRLTTRVHKLSRRLWHRLKLLSAAKKMSVCKYANSANTTSSCDQDDTTPRKLATEDEVANLRVKLELYERKLKEKDDILAQALFSNVRRRDSLFRLVDQHSSFSNSVSDLLSEPSANNKNNDASLTILYHEPEQTHSSSLKESHQMLNEPASSDTQTESSPLSSSALATTPSDSHNERNGALPGYRPETGHFYFTPSPRWAHQSSKANACLLELSNCR